MATLVENKDKIWKQGKNENFMEFLKRTNKELERLMEKGVVLSFPHADSYAYYEVVNDRELLKLAQRDRVYPVSPTTLYAHLQTILLSFEGQKIELKAKQVFSMLRAIQKDYEKVEDGLSKLQRHLGNAYNVMSSVLTSFTQLGQKIKSTQSLGSGDKDELKD